MKMEKAYCPNCGAPVFFKDGRDDTFCQHCGTQVFKTDEQLELKLKYKHKQFDRELEHFEKSEKSDNSLFKWGLVFIIICFILIIIADYLGISK